MKANAKQPYVVDSSGFGEGTNFHASNLEKIIRVGEAQFLLAKAYEAEKNKIAEKYKRLTIWQDGSWRVFTM